MQRLAACTLTLIAVCCAVGLSVGAAGQRSPAEVFGGLGTWLDIFADRSWSQPAAVVASAEAHGVGTLYLQTSNFSQTTDLVRPAAIGRFVEAAHAAGLKVVAWYLPGFSNPALDARRALAAVRFRSVHGQGFDGFALDIEASSVANVPLRSARLLALAQRLRHAARASFPLAAIIPSPVGMRRHPHYWPRFPYAPLAQVFDAFLPMAYFSYYAHTPAAAYSYARDVVLAIRAKTGRPDELIHVIGGSAKVIPAATLAGFVAAVSDCGAQGISLYSFPQTSARDWTDLAAANLGGAATHACAFAAEPPNARITGEVRVCNIPGHCLTRVFRVSATDSAGRLVAHTTTSGPDNRYRLLVPARHYSLLAVSHGLRCKGSTTAVANRTVSANIICLVP